MAKLGIVVGLMIYETFSAAAWLHICEQRLEANKTKSSFHSTTVVALNQHHRNCLVGVCRRSLQVHWFSR